MVHRVKKLAAKDGEKRNALFYFLIFILCMYALCKITSSLSCLLIFVL